MKVQGKLIGLLVDWVIRRCSYSRRTSYKDVMRRNLFLTLVIVLFKNSKFEDWRPAGMSALTSDAAPFAH